VSQLLTSLLSTSTTNPWPRLARRYYPLSELITVSKSFAPGDVEILSSTDAFYVLYVRLHAIQIVHYLAHFSRISIFAKPKKNYSQNLGL
jgi:hypothetical protein